MLWCACLVIYPHLQSGAGFSVNFEISRFDLSCKASSVAREPFGRRQNSGQEDRNRFCWGPAGYRTTLSLGLQQYCQQFVEALWRLMQAAQLSFFCVPIGRPYTVKLASAFQQLLRILKVSKAGGAEMTLREG